MKIFPNSKPEQDKQLPHADTCFFNVSLPAYSSQILMREKLLIAIKHTTSIDGDTVTTDDIPINLNSSIGNMEDDLYS